jgi:hypothetical protein
LKYKNLLDPFPLDVIVAEAGFAAQTGVLAEPIAGLALQRLSLDNLKNN